MTDSVLIGLSIAGGIITVVGALIGLGYRMGCLSSDVKENTKDISQIQAVWGSGLKDVNDKLDRVLASVNDICQRVSNLEGRMK